MTLMRYQPWSGLSHIHKDIDRLFSNSLGNYDDDAQLTAWTPAVDVSEEEDRFVIHADVPGVDPSDIDITMEKGLLTISGHRHSEEKEEGKH